jgi:hypothetical protein
MRMRGRWLLLGGVLVVLAAIGIAVLLRMGAADEGLPPKTFIVDGTVRLTGQPGVHSGQPCAGTGADADLRDGATVTVYGAAGETLGVGQLIDGVGTPDDTGTAADGAVACVWRFFVTDVRADRDTYLVEVTGRGRHRYDASSIHNRIDLTVPAG